MNCTTGKTPFSEGYFPPFSFGYYLIDLFSLETS